MEDAAMEDVLTHHIDISPGVAGGKPRITGHRITVQNIVIWHERMGISADEIAATYDLTLADVYAALGTTTIIVQTSMHRCVPATSLWPNFASARAPGWMKS